VECGAPYISRAAQVSLLGISGYECEKRSGLPLAAIMSTGRVIVIVIVNVMIE